MKRMMLALLAATALAGCGLKGGLERPPPLWGDPAPQAPAEAPAPDDADEAESAQPQ